MSINPTLRLNLKLDQVLEIQSKFDPEHPIHKYITIFLFKQSLERRVSTNESDKSKLNVDEIDYDAMTKQIINHKNNIDEKDL